MTLFLTVLHIVACLVLVAVVLLQRGKGADMGAMLGGGGANTVFGARGAGNFLTRVTAACAVVFMVTSLSLSYLGQTVAEDLIFDEEAVEEPAPGAAGGLQEVPAPAEEGASTGTLQEVPAPAGERGSEAGSEEAPGGSSG